MSGVTWPMMKLFIQLEEAVTCQVGSHMMRERIKVLTSNRNTIRTLREWPNFGNNDPSTRAPAVTEVDHEKPDHNHSCPASTFVSLPLVFILSEDDCDDDVTGRHSNRANNEDGLATEFVDVGYGRHGREPHDNTNDTTCEQRGGISGKTQALEDLYYVSSTLSLEPRGEFEGLPEEHSTRRR